MRVSIVVIVFVVASALAGEADACTCISPDPKRPLGPRDVQFEATVEGIDVVQPPPPADYTPSPNSVYVGGRLHVVRLKDIKALHGEPKTTVLTYPSSSCGYHFQIGIRYFIDAGRREDGTLTVGVCGLTGPSGPFQHLLSWLKGLMSR